MVAQVKRLLEPNWYRSHWAQLAAYVLIAVVTIVAFAVLRHQNGRIDRVASSTHDALCAFKNDLEHRAGATRSYLAQHPNMQLIVGVDRSVIERSLRQQELTLTSLSALTCDQTKGAP